MESIGIVNAQGNTVIQSKPRQIKLKDGGETLELGGRRFEVAYTPGHASHHVSYFEPATGVAFVGDTAGLRTPRMEVVLPATPPPEFNLEAWLVSIEVILAWQPREIVLTHFGPATDPVAHFAELKAGLIIWTEYARESLTVPGEDRERIAWFTDRLEQWLFAKVPADRGRRFLAGAGPESCWQGLARYCRMQAKAALES